MDKNTSQIADHVDPSIEPGIWIYDIETYPNHFLAVFKRLQEDKQGDVKIYNDNDLDALREFVSKDGLTLVGYNNFKFDDVIIKSILDSKVNNASEIHHLADHIINGDESNDSNLRALTYNGRKHWNYRTSPWHCVDLFQILGGPRVAGSLKSHEVRLGMLDVRDLPFEPGTTLTPSQINVLLTYCQHDVNATEALFYDVQEEVDVRLKVNDRFPYLKGSALRSSNSGIAEKVMQKELQIRAGIKKHDIKKPERYTFDPSIKLDATIEFQSEHNQSLLKRLRDLTPFEPRDWLEGLNTGYTFKIGSHDIALGRGGAHTIIPAKVVTSENIVEFDVDSYYPSMLRRFGEYPAGLTHEWIEILNELTDARLDAKASGDKSTADVYKIIINSIYGKLEDNYSINLDPRLQLQVVLNGQLFLLMLMERFHESGFDVISANTDGVYINAGIRLNDAQHVADQWVSETGFKLSQTIASIYVATSVNNYALYHPEHGWFHKKGQFARGKRTTPMVITDAVLDHFSTGKPVADYIAKTNSFLDFFYSSTVGKRNLIEVKHGNDTIQCTNRWYKTLSGDPIEKCVTDANGNVKHMRVPNSEDAVIANRLSSFSIPSDLNNQHYIDKAISLLNDILKGKPSSLVRHNRLITNAKKLQKKGLVIVPKGFPDNEKANIPNTYTEEVIAYWGETPLESANWSGYQGFGAYTGNEFGIVAIDIDDPTKASSSGLFDVLGKSGMIAWHGDFGHSDILNGTKRGTIIFKYDGESLHTTDAKYFFEHGFEILYGKKVVQLAGPHPDGHDYKYRGSLKPIPKKLLNFLEWSIPDADPAVNTTPAVEDTDSDNESYQKLEKCVIADQQYPATSGKFRSEDSKWGKQLVGLCIGKREHTNHQGDQDMRVYLSGGEVRTHCFHQSCWSVRRQWVRDINDVYNGNKSITVNPDNLIVEGKEREIINALNNNNKYKLIISPTGSGKTHAIVTHIAPYLDSESGNNDKFAIICSSKDQMIQLGERFSAILESDNINNQGIDLIESTSSIKIGDAASRDSVRDDTRVAITHFTYVSRRGFSQYYYAFLKYIDNNTHVFIDEIDAFVESQTTHYPLGSRKRRVTTGGLFKNFNVTKCGMFHRYNNCTNCKMRMYDGNRLDINDYRNLDYIPIAEYMEGTQLTQLAHINIEPRVIATVRVNTSEVQMLKQKDKPGPILFDDNGAAADFTAIFEDHLDSSYLPTVHRSVMLYDGNEITREEFIQRFNLDHNSSISDIPDEERTKLRFPSRSCNVLTVTTIDRRPLLWIANAKSFTGLTATMLHSQERFLSSTINEEIQRFQIEPIDDRKMDKIIVIAKMHDIPLSMYINGNLQFDKMFRYRETKKSAQKDFEKIRNSNVPIRMGYDRRKYMLTSDENDYGEHRIMQTYAFSTLGRGVDFASYDVVNINAAIYKPISAYVTNDPESLSEQMQDDRINIVIQNVGRILRRAEGATEAVKIVIVENFEDESDLSKLAERLAHMSLSPVESWWIPEFIDAEEYCDYISRTIEEKKLPDNLPHDHTALIDRASTLVNQGHKKTAIKKALKWPTTRKKLKKKDALEVEAAIDNLLEDHRHSDNRDLTPKEIKQREKRSRRINQLREAGKTDGQIRNSMNVYSGKYPWPEREQLWLEETLNPEVQL